METPQKKIRKLSQIEFFNLVEWIRGQREWIQEQLPAYEDLATKASEETKINTSERTIISAAKVAHVGWKPKQRRIKAQSTNAKLAWNRHKDRSNRMERAIYEIIKGLDGLTPIGPHCQSILNEVEQKLRMEQGEQHANEDDNPTPAYHLRQGK